MVPALLMVACLHAVPSTFYQIHQLPNLHQRILRWNNRDWFVALYFEKLKERIYVVLVKSSWVMQYRYKPVAFEGFFQNITSAFALSQFSLPKN